MPVIEIVGGAVGLLLASVLVWRGQYALFCWVLAALIAFDWIVRLSSGADGSMWPWAAAGLTLVAGLSYKLPAERQLSAATVLMGLSLTIAIVLRFAFSKPLYAGA